MFGLFPGSVTALEVVMCIMAAVLLLLCLIVIINCCAQCCCGKDNLASAEEEDQRFFDKDYYDEICTLLYRHKQMEVELARKENGEIDKNKQSNNQMIRDAKNETSKVQFRPDQEKLMLLKKELEQYRVDHDVKIRRDAEQAVSSKRRTWGGLQEDGKFEPLELPDDDSSLKTVIIEKGDQVAKTDGSKGHETAV